MSKTNFVSLESFSQIDFINDDNVRKLFSEYQQIIHAFFTIQSPLDQDSISNYIKVFSDYLVTKNDENSFTKLINLLFFFAQKRPTFLGTISDLFLKVQNHYEAFQENIDNYIDLISQQSNHLSFLCNYFKNAFRDQNADTYNESVFQLLFPPDKLVNRLLSIIFNDDYDTLLTFIESSTENFTIDQIITLDDDDPFYLLYGFKSITLIDLAALFDSPICFKYLLEKNCIVTELTVRCSFIGGNCEIITLIRNNISISFNFCLETSIEYHQYHLTEWLLTDNCNTSVSPSECLKLYNFHAFYYFYSNGKSLDETNSDNYNSLETACSIGFIPAVEFILLQDSNIKQKISKSFIPLHIATKYVHTQIIKYLFSNVYGDNMKNMKDEKGKTILHYACQYNILPLVEFLISIGFDIDAIDLESNTPLLTSCKSEFNCIHIIEYLISHGCSKDSKDKERRTALHISCEIGNVEYVHYLVSQGCDIDSSDKHRNRPIHYACGQTSLTPLISYINQRNNQSSFTERLIEIVQHLVSRGCDKNAKNIQGMTPLHVSCKHGFIDIVKYLISQGCDSYSRDAKGRIPLHYCIKSNHLDVFKYFISIGFDINIRDNKGRTPLHLSIKFRSREIKLHLLFNNSCKKCIPDNNGKTPLQYAIDANDTEATDILLYGVILPIIFKIT